MKKRYILLLTLLAITMLLCCSCLPNFSESNGKLTDNKSGITYTGAPVCFEPALLAEKPFAKCSKLKIELYEIIGQSTSEWISEPYDGIGGVYYADGITLPTLTEFDADTLHICVEQTITVGLTIVTDKETIDAVAAAFTDGEPCAIVQSGQSYQLKFESAKYVGIYYSLIYVEGSDGENYIYDRSTQTCINVGDVLQEFMRRSVS